MIDLCISPEKCCGCTACKNVCPQSAISMKEAENGFLYPRIDEGKCIKCGLCLKTCDFKNFTKTGEQPQCYAARHKTPIEVSTSRSGAVFMAMCHEIVNRGGVCFGAQLTDEQKVIHKMEDSYEGCAKFKGSKYVQSDMLDCFSECADYLKTGYWVLFSGTGCQVHGLLKYLQTKQITQDKLITVDIVCHGVPSPGVWEKYIEILEKKENKQIKEVDFRDKQLNGWSDHVEKYVFEDETKMNSKRWTEVFYRHVLFRESCYRCVYTTTERLSDYTIADYWRVGVNAPQFDDNKGCSLVMIHSEKGKNFFEELKELLVIQETKLSTSMQPQMMRPVWRGWDYSLFWSLWRKNPNKCINQYFFPSIVTKGLRKLEKEGKKILKKFIKIIKRH